MFNINVEVSLLTWGQHDHYKVFAALIGSSHWLSLTRTIIWQRVTFIDKRDKFIGKEVEIDLGMVNYLSTIGNKISLLWVLRLSGMCISLCYLPCYWVYVHIYQVYYINTNRRFWYHIVKELPQQTTKLFNKQFINQTKTIKNNIQNNSKTDSKLTT